MIAEYFGKSRENMPTSAIASQQVVYDFLRSGTVDNLLSLAPRPATGALPAAALIYQVQHGRETNLIDEYNGLGENWDGYDADRISDSACAAAKAFLVSLPSNFESPELCPNPGGTISMEWESLIGQAQLEVGKSKFSFYLRRKGGATIYQRGDAAMALSICGLLAMLYTTPRPSAIASIEY